MTSQQQPTPRLEEEEKSYLVFDDYDENTLFILLLTHLLSYFFNKIFDRLINKYHNKNLNLSKV